MFFFLLFFHDLVLSCMYRSGAILWPNMALRREPFFLGDGKFINQIVKSSDYQIHVVADVQ